MHIKRSYSLSFDFASCITNLLCLNCATISSNQFAHPISKQSIDIVIIRIRFPAAMIPKNYSTLNTTKSDTYRIVSPSSILRDSISAISSKFSTSQSYYLVSTIDQAVQNKKCRLKEVMKDEEYNRQEEILQQYCTLQQGEKQLPELTEYYKYYTQTSIIYQQNFFKMMHQYRQKRKVIQYNRLKVLLNLSHTTENSEAAEKDRKNSTPISSFYILSKLNTTLFAQDDNEESETLARLRHRLEKSLGPNCYRTVEELDRNYHFQKKFIDNVPSLDVKCFKKIKISRQQKENYTSQLKNSKLRHNKRNNSCELVSTPKRTDIKLKTYNKKKNLSMDNLNTLAKDYQIKETKHKLFGNWIKSTELKSVKGEQSRQKERISQERLRSEDNQRDCDIRSKILDTKQRIRKEKLQLKKKTTLATNQSETIKSMKKVTTTVQDKHKNRKLVKIAFL